MAHRLLQIRRGIKSKLPQLSEGELGFVTDKDELYIGRGNGKGNLLINDKVWEGTCTTGDATAAKEVNVGEGFELVDGAKVRVYFTNRNSVTDPTLNVNGTGAAEICYNNLLAAGVDAWAGYSYLELTYVLWKSADGNIYPTWIIDNYSIGNDAVKGIVSIADRPSDRIDASKGIAVSPKALRVVELKAEGALPKTGGILSDSLGIIKQQAGSSSITFDMQALNEDGSMGSYYYVTAENSTTGTSKRIIQGLEGNYDAEGNEAQSKITTTVSTSISQNYRTKNSINITLQRVNTDGTVGTMAIQNNSQHRQIAGLTDPQSPTQAATKNYVDNVKGAFLYYDGTNNIGVGGFTVAEATGLSSWTIQFPDDAQTVKITVGRDSVGSNAGASYQTKVTLGTSAPKVLGAYTGQATYVFDQAWADQIKIENGSNVTNPWVLIEILRI